MSLKPIAIAAAGLAFLAGCAQTGAPVTWNASIKDNYDVGSLDGAVTSPGIRVSVVGETYGADRTALADNLADIIRESHFGPRVTFASQIGEDESYRDFEVRFLFSPQPGAPAYTLCEDESFKQRPPEVGATEFLAAYCRKGERINSVRGRVSGDFESASFRRLVQQASLTLFPPPGFLFDSDRGGEYDQ